MTLLAEGELLVAVHALVNPIVTAVQREHGPLPSMKTVEFLDADRAVRLATLLVVAEAYLVDDPHQVIRAALRDTSQDVHGGDSATWASWRAWRAVHAARGRVVTMAPCTGPDCGKLINVRHPLPDLTTVSCPRCRGRRSGA